MIDWTFIAEKALRALLFLPLALAFMVAALLAVGWVFGIGRDNTGSWTPMRKAFDRLEGDPRSLAMFLGAVVIAAALVSAGLVQ